MRSKKSKKSETAEEAELRQQKNAARREREAQREREDLERFRLEHHLQDAIVELARAHGWLIYHCPCFLHGAHGFEFDSGWPDLFLARGARVIFAELKSPRGALSHMQRTWLATLAQCPGVEVYLWQPSSWEQIEQVLKPQVEQVLKPQVEQVLKPQVFAPQPAVDVATDLGFEYYAT